MALALSCQQTRMLTAAIASLGSAAFASRLLDFLRDQVSFDSSVIMAYPEDAKLVILHDELSARDRVLFDGPYRNGLYLLSPLYVQAHAGTRGYFHISEIAPEGFTDSEFYQLYYSANGAIGIPIAISIERTEALPTFRRSEKALLKSLADLVGALVRQQRWADKAMDRTAMPRDMHAHLQQVLDKFGSSVLTPRARRRAADSEGISFEVGGARACHQHPDRAGTSQAYLP